MKRLIADEQLTLFDVQFNSLKDLINYFKEDVIIKTIDKVVLKHVYNDNVLKNINNVNINELSKILDWDIILKEVYKELDIQQELNINKDIINLWVNKSNFIDINYDNIIKNVQNKDADNFIKSSKDVIKICEDNGRKYYSAFAQVIFPNFLKQLSNDSVAEEYYKVFPKDFYVYNGKILCTMTYSINKYKKMCKALIQNNFELMTQTMDEEIFQRYKLTVIDTTNIVKDLVDIGFNSIYAEIIISKLVSYVEKSNLENIINISKLPIGIYNIKNLNELEDKVGKTHKILQSIDVLERERPIVYLDGEIIFGDKGSTHIQTVNKYKTKLKEQYSRNDKSITELKDNFNDIAFGHYSDNVVLIENNVVGNVNKNDFAQKLKQQTEYPVNKVYNYNESKKTVKRLAKLSNEIIDKLKPYFLESDNDKDFYYSIWLDDKKILNKNNYKQVYDYLNTIIKKQEYKKPNATIDKYLQLSNLVCKPNISVVDKTNDVNYKHNADADKNRINVKRDEYFSDQMFDHEIGHALSSSNSELGNAIAMNYGNVFGKYNVKINKFEGIYNEANPEEAWAQSYSYYINFPNNLKSNYPETYKVVDHIVKNIVNHDEIRRLYYEKLNNL